MSYVKINYVDEAKALGLSLEDYMNYRMDMQHLLDEENEKENNK